MYTRAELKQFAKEQIRGNIGAYFLCMLVISLLSCVSLIPFVGGVAVALFSPALTMGLVMLLLGMARGEKMEVGGLFQYFPDWWKAFKVCFLVGLYVMLWSLLFVIPGYVKAYSYSMALYILAENPDMTASEAITASKNLMNGHKWELFVLQLSFILWGLLCTVTCGIASIYVMPYMSMTTINFYHMISNQPINAMGNVVDEQQNFNGNM